ncbi:phosphoribosylanthranilate isomerase [Cyanobium sp. CH-040]|uniref:phosphoribosylanthranilate isomerase n=1 Tax=Cyanobium sp. CH-040 TaxID=2823708 RepID=UPI0020CEA7BD|nr:phosphoribosylanthranilate isomerase [Cyanobium sp. CH-040]
MRHPDQAAAVAALGADAIGVIAVPSSPRFVPPEARQAVFAAARSGAAGCQGVLVVADPGDDQLPELDAQRGHRVVQLHGSESPQRCRQLRERSGCLVWKALRLRRPHDLQSLAAYADAVDALLLDAWVPDQLGGTGHAIPLDWLEGWAAPLPWWLAGGIRAERVAELLARLSPTGLDASSGVEAAPGEKDLAKVEALLKAVGRSA